MADTTTFLRASDDEDFTERVKKLADWVKNGNDIQPTKLAVTR